MIFFRQQGGSCGREWASFSEGAAGMGRADGCSSGVDFEAVNFGSTGLTAGRWSTIDLLVDGGTIRIYVDGVLRLNAADPDPLTVGALALTTTGPAPLRLDDLQIYGPPETRGSV